MSLTVIAPAEEGVFEDASIHAIEPAHHGQLRIKTFWGTYEFFYKNCNRVNFNILMFTDNNDVFSDKFLIGNADEIDEVMNVIEAAKNLCEEAYNARA